MKNEIIEKVFKVIPEIRGLLFPDSEIYQLFDSIIHDYFKSMRGKGIIDFEPIKELRWPYVFLGNLSSYDLFGLNGFIHYVYLHKNYGFYKTIFDVGGNTGLDSIVLEKFGYKVYAFEPDPLLAEMFENNVKLNNSKNISIINKALSNDSGTKKFVRVKGNLTASHIEGSRDYYGDVDYFNVESITFNDLDMVPDIIKINIEGFEKHLIPSIPLHFLERCDFIISVHNERARDVIFSFFQEQKLDTYSQKIGWKKALIKDDLPGLNKEGYIFASKKNKMLW